MRTMAVLGATACVVAVLSACDAPGVVRPQGEVKPSATEAPTSAPRPMSGTIVGSDAYGQACGGGLGIWLVSTGTGTVSHFGKAVMVSTMCVNLTDYSVIGDAPYFLQAANGDKVEGLLTGLVYTDYGFDMYTSVTSGTGRFHGVTGELVWPTRSTGTGTWSSGVAGWIQF